MLLLLLMLLMSLLSVLFCFIKSHQLYLFIAGSSIYATKSHADERWNLWAFCRHKYFANDIKWSVVKLLGVQSNTFGELQTLYTMPPYRAHHMTSRASMKVESVLQRNNQMVIAWQTVILDFFLLSAFFFCIINSFLFKFRM